MPLQDQSLTPADLIFAIAGRPPRKVHALELFRSGYAPRLLLSFGRFELRRAGELDLPAPVDLVAAAKAIPAPQRHFFVLFDGAGAHVEPVRRRRFGTWNELRALACWLALRPEIRSLLIVSGGAHLRRVRMCCRALLPEQLQLRFLGVPDGSQPQQGAGSRHADSLPASVLAEWLKIPLYLVLVWVQKLRTRWGALAGRISDGACSTRSGTVPLPPPRPPRCATARGEREDRGPTRERVLLPLPRRCWPHPARRAFPGRAS